VADGLTASFERLFVYAADLAERLEAQEAWHLRNPEWPAGSLHAAPDELFERDPYPGVQDVLTSRRFLDLVNIALAAYMEQNRD